MRLLSVWPVVWMFLYMALYRNTGVSELASVKHNMYILVYKLQAGGVKRDSNGATKTKTEDKPSPVSQSKPRVDYNHWSHGLLASMKDPNLKVLEKPDHVVIKVN